MSGADGYDVASVRDDLRTRPVDDPDDPGARDVQDPHEWSDDGPSILERLVPETAAQKIGAAALLLVAGGLVYYLAPIFITPLTSPWALAALLFLGYTGGIYLKGRTDGIAALVDLDKSIIYYGQSADVRLGESGDVEGREQTFVPLKVWKWAGLVSKALTKSDLPFDASRLRNKTLGSDSPGEEPVRDRLNRSTVTVETDTFGTVHVTHSSGLSIDGAGKRTDRYTEPPKTIDEDVAEEFRLQHQELRHELKQLHQQLDLLQDANSDMRHLRNEQSMPQVEQTMGLIEDLLVMTNTRRATRTNGKTSSGDEAAQKRVERQAEKMIDE